MQAHIIAAAASEHRHSSHHSIQSSRVLYLAILHMSAQNILKPFDESLDELIIRIYTSFALMSGFLVV